MHELKYRCIIDSKWVWIQIFNFCLISSENKETVNLCQRTLLEDIGTIIAKNCILLDAVQYSK